MQYFIELPCIIYDQHEQQLTDKCADECELIEVRRIIDVRRIEGYHEAVPISDFDENNKIWTEVTMYSGVSFIVNLRIAQFEQLLHNFLMQQ